MSQFFSSSSSNSSSVEYEVFISFRGSDTRYAFISHLREALGGRTIVTFTDEKLRRGDEISPALSNAIKKSQVAVVIFSKDFASSKWCLNELVEILECKKEHRQIVIPVFYHVTPTHVRKQTESYERSFVEHEKKGIPVETLQKWRIALTEASNLSGYDTDVVRDEASLTKKIVDDVWKELRVTYKIDNKNLVGIESKVEEIISLLKMGSGDVCVVGIWGIGGIGKTTLASVVFNEIRIQFGGCCFLGNIRERSETADGLNGLRQQLYSDISGEKSGKIFDDMMLNFLLSRKKVLIVFDDVTDIEQIENIVGGVNRSNGESRFIITTRNRQILNCYCKEENIYEVNGLCDKEALQLFSRFAFKQEHPEEDYTELSRKMVDYAKGSPLALKVLGSSLYKKSKPIWKSAIERLKKVPKQEIQRVLKVSFDGLDYEQKEVFLDVACFFKENLKEDIVNLYDESFEFTLDTLIDRCLVSIDSSGRITMHDLLQEMGRQIVREESIENPGKRSRLWHPDDIRQVLTRDEGTSVIKAILLDMSKTGRIHLNKNPFIKMSNLRFLIIYDSSSKLSCSEDFKCDSPKLAFLSWECYPMKTLESSFILENLVSLKMPNSNVEQLWNGTQCLPNLKEMYLNNSENLTTIPDLSLARKLERIYLFGCGNLTSLPPCDCLESLEYLNLCGCENLKAIPELPCNVTQLALYQSGITRLPSSFGNLPQRVSLKFERAFTYWCDPEELSNFKSLQILDVSFSGSAVGSVCSHLSGLSNIAMLDIREYCTAEVLDAICQISSLKVLDLPLNDFDKLSENIMQLSKLKHLDLFACHKLQFLPELPRSLEYLCAESCDELKAVHDSLSTLLATTKMVSFTSCDMLDKHLFRTIIQDALLEIQRRLRERPAQAIEEDEDGYCFRDIAYICYPGREIPEIFEFQHLGSTISKELSHDMIGGKIVGFAFFVVYKNLELSEGPRINFHCKITSENREWFPLRAKLECCFYGPSTDSDVAVGYTQNCTFPSQYESILLELEFMEDGSLFEVEKCGFHLFSVPVSKEERKETFSSSSKGKQLETSPKGLQILLASPFS